MGVLAFALFLPIAGCGATPVEEATAAATTPATTPATGDCTNWATSITPDATGSVSPTEAVDAYLAENPGWSSVPARDWVIPETPEQSGMVTARADPASLELTRLPDLTWLATAGQRC